MAFWSATVFPGCGTLFNDKVIRVGVTSDPHGAQVYVDGVSEFKTDLIEFGDFMKYTFEARDGKAYLMGKLLRTDSEEITLEKVVNGKIR